MSPDELKQRRNGGRGSYDHPIRTTSEARRSAERKHSQEMEDARRQRQRQRDGEEEDLQKAIELSKREEEERLKKIRESNNGGLFDVSRCAFSIVFLSAYIHLLPP